MQCLNEEVLQPMVSCVKRLPRIMAAEGLAALWPSKASSGIDLAGIIIGNDALNACRYCPRSKCISCIMHCMHSAI